MKQKLLLTLWCLFLLSSITAQKKRNCHTMDNFEYRKIKNPSIKDKLDEIEKFTQKKLLEIKEKDQKIEGDIIKIPVVVHIIYSNDDENISMEQIQSQIDVLNEDFRRLNSDKTEQWLQAADSGIEFYLAQVDPNGNLTNGVTRKFSSRTSWGTADAMKLSSQGGVDAWNTSEYFNMWVCNIGGGILGYAQFPGGEAATDGVVMGHQYFGSSDKGTDFYLSAPFDKGRTTTHEVGHFLNLRHIWGDGGCGVDDFVEDTPESDGSNFGCATTHESCGSLDMVQNFMDYSDDACMNLFTIGQKNRMRAVLEEGGVRNELALSDKTTNLSCSASIPSGLSASNITYDEATISWEQVTNASYEIRYRPVGANDWFLITASQIPTIIKDLTGLTEYEVQVKSICPSESSDYSPTITFITTETPPMYCESAGTNVSDEHIQIVQIGTINNTSETNTGYSDYTDISTNLEKGIEHTITVTPEWSDTVFKEGWGVFIDYNQDYDFDDEGEVVYVKEPSSEVPFTGTFVIPDNALSGATRMRVVLKFNSTPDACGIFSYGETEDYTVIIGEGDNEAPTAPSKLKSYNVTPITVDLSWNRSKDDSGMLEYDIYQNSQLIKTVLDTTATIDGLSAKTKYFFNVMARDNAGNESESSNTISVTTKKLKYCKSKGKNAAYEWIDYVRFGGMKNKTKSDGGYGNFTNKVANVERGTTNTIVISAEFRSLSYLEYWKVWIDFNQDGTFSDSEEVVSGSSSKNKNLKRKITIPDDAKLGKTRMRVSMKSDAQQTTCEKFDFGEVEDYSVNIKESSGRLFANAYLDTDLNEEQVLGYEERKLIHTYPSPVIDILNINTNKIIQGAMYRIVDSAGKVFIDSNELKRRIDVSNLNTGIYVLEIHDTQKTLKTKFIKK